MNVFLQMILYIFFYGFVTGIGSILLVELITYLVKKFTKRGE